MNSACLTLFEIVMMQAAKLHTAVTRVDGGACIDVVLYDTNDANPQTYTAWLCETSHEYHLKRVALLDAHKAITLVICRKHTSVLPLPVLSIQDGRRDEAYDAPTWYTTEKRIRKNGSIVFLGALLCGVESAWTVLKDLPPTTKWRYEKRIDAIAKGKRGRPVYVPGVSR